MYPTNEYSIGDTYESRDGSQFTITDMTRTELRVTDPNDRHPQSARAYEWSIDPMMLRSDIRENRVSKVDMNMRDDVDLFPEL
jgi:hypothetical protein